MTRRASRPSIALATAERFASLDESDRAARTALEARGAVTRPVVWSDASVDWSAFDVVVVRSCWDYFEHVDDFRAWIDRIERLGVAMWNPPALLRWNMDKRYLRELESRGVRIVPTAWAERGHARALASIVEAHGWDEVVVKPAVSANGARTWRARRETADAHEAAFARLVAERDVMVQRFMPEIARDGEWSMVFLGGAFSHAVRKVAAPGEFRVQNEHGGASHPATAPRALVAAAESVLSLVREPWLYARVDGCVSDGAFVLMELEMLEPSLYLVGASGAAERFAEGVMARV